MSVSLDVAVVLLTSVQSSDFHIYSSGRPLCQTPSYSRRLLESYLGVLVLSPSRTLVDWSRDSAGPGPRMMCCHESMLHCRRVERRGSECCSATHRRHRLSHSHLHLHLHSHSHSRSARTDSADDAVSLRTCLVSKQPECSWETCLHDNDYMEVQPLSHHIAPFADYTSGTPVMRASGQGRFRLLLASSHRKVRSSCVAIGSLCVAGGQNRKLSSVIDARSRSFLSFLLKEIIMLRKEKRCEVMAVHGDGGRGKQRMVLEFGAHRPTDSTDSTPTYPARTVHGGG